MNGVRQGDESNSPQRRWLVYGYTDKVCVEKKMPGKSSNDNSASDACTFTWEAAFKRASAKGTEAQKKAAGDAANRLLHPESQATLRFGALNCKKPVG